MTADRKESDRIYRRTHAAEIAAYRAAHREQAKEYMRAYRRRPDYAAKRKAWELENAERLTAYRRRYGRIRRARAKQAREEEQIMREKHIVSHAQALANFAAAEAADCAEDIAEGENVDIRLRIIEAALDFRRLVDRKEPIEAVQAALTEAFARRGLRINQ